MNMRGEQLVSWTILLIITLIGVGLSLGKEDPGQRAEQVIAGYSICIEQPSDACYRSATVHALRLYRPADLIGLFEEAQQSNPSVYSRCHTFSHYVGRLVYERTRGLSRAYAQGRAGCHNGFYHGVMEILLAEKGEQIFSSETVSKLCGEEKDMTVAMREICLHGLGHGFMFYTNNDLPQSLGYCDLLPEQYQRNHCYGGIFHENIDDLSNPDHPSEWVKSDDLAFPCTVLEERYLSVCWSQAAGHAISVLGDFTEAFRFCDNAPDQHESICANGLAITIPGHTGDTGQAARICTDDALSHQRSACVQGAVESYIERHAGNGAQARNFCQGLPGEWKERCYQAFAQRLKAWQTNITMECQQVEPDYQQLCLTV